MQINSSRRWWALATLLTLPVLALSQATQQNTTLAISGMQGTARVVQVGGRNYVEVEGLARIANGSLSFNGSQIILALPGSGSGSSATATDSAPPPPAPGFSKDFLTAGIEAMAQIREWHSVLRNAIERGFPLTDDWLGTYRGQAQQALHLASVAINTSSDKNAYPYLVNEFNNMKNLSDKYMQMTKSMNYTAPNSLQTDPLNQKILTCARFLATMATANQINDDGSCQ